MRWTQGLFVVRLIALSLLWCTGADSSEGDVTPAPPAKIKMKVSCSPASVGMGRTAVVEARLRMPDGQPGRGCLVLPYVDGRRWGAHEIADSEGRVTCLLPFPNPGIHEIQLEALPPLAPAIEEWIWSPETRDDQSVFFQFAFDLPPLPKSCVLWIAADDKATVWLNGQLMGDCQGWTDPKCLPVPAGSLKEKGNILSVEGYNYNGPAGILVRMEASSGRSKNVVASQPRWQCFKTRPAGWPGKTEALSSPCVTVGTVTGSQWSQSMKIWPTQHSRDLLMTGRRLTATANVSKPIPIRVVHRALERIPSDPDHLVGMQWEPWFTPMNAFWQTAQAVPVMGFFQSFDRDVIRQHMLWMMESGVDFLVVDWTNHLWDKAHWSDRPDATNEIIHATTLALEELASLREEGFEVPKVVLYPGLNNGPATTMAAVNEELDWIQENYVRNPRFKGLFLDDLGKPLVLIHNGGGPNWIKERAEAPAKEEDFTIRWQSSQHQVSHHNESGYWSWMDGSLEQGVTFLDGKPEALTVSTAFFGPGGWLAPDAFGRRGGWTYVESFKAALRHRPRFIEIHQFNEFAGQPEGQGYGPKKDVYCDSYSVEFSDDIEPVSLTAPAYRGEGGWGFFFLNLTRALVDLYRQDPIETTVVAVSKPALRGVAKGSKLEVEWTWIGKDPESFTIEIDGEVKATGLKGNRATVDLSKEKPGPKRLRLTANGTESRYLLSFTEDSLPLKTPVPAFVEVPFFLTTSP